MFKKGLFSEYSENYMQKCALEPAKIKGSREIP